jgi:predicted flap endonuclease-1-like 5' DNA nuclease
LPASAGRPALGALTHAGIATLQDVARLSEKELLGLHGVGPKAVRVLREALVEQGLALRTDA